MHDSVFAWVGERVAEADLAERSTLEVGSLNVNGSVRPHFSGLYVGIDQSDGPGVDLVADAHAIPFPSRSFDVVVCTEVLEHDAAFWLTLAEIRRILRPGGHALITTRGNGFGEHRFPVDLWRFMPDSMPVLAELAGCDPLAFRLDWEVPGVFVHGVRRQ